MASAALLSVVLILTKWCYIFSLTVAVWSLSCSITPLYRFFGWLVTCSEWTLTGVAVSGPPSGGNRPAETDSPVDLSSFSECDWTCKLTLDLTKMPVWCMKVREINSRFCNCHPCDHWQNSEFSWALLGELRITVSYPKSTVEFPSKSRGASTKRPWGVCPVPVRSIEKSVCATVNSSSFTSTKFVTLNFETRETPPVILSPWPIALRSPRTTDFLYDLYSSQCLLRSHHVMYRAPSFKKKKMFTLWVWFISISAFWHIFF